MQEDNKRKLIMPTIRYQRVCIIMIIIIIIMLEW